LFRGGKLIPARVRGHADLLINSTFWMGSVASLFLLRPGLFRIDIGWRFVFLIGAAGLVILTMRRFVSESPRWLLIHRGTEEAEKVVEEIEKKVATDPGTLPPPEGTLRMRVRKKTQLREIWHAMAHEHCQRSILSFSLMVTRAFFYNTVLFTYSLVLLRYHRVAPEKLGCR
jgi:hypothetical protein